MQHPFRLVSVGVGLCAGLALVRWQRHAGTPSGRPAHTSRPRSRRGVARTTILRDPDDLYDLWQWSELPKWFPVLTAVRRDGDGLRWTANVAGRDLSWETQLSIERRGEALAWHSAPGAPVATRGAVHFAAAPAGRGTEVVLAMHFDGAAGRRLARPALAALCEGLRRFKQRAETGELATIVGQPSGREPERQRPELRRATAQPGAPAEHAATPLLDVQREGV